MYRNCLADMESFVWSGLKKNSKTSRYFHIKLSQSIHVIANTEVKIPKRINFIIHFTENSTSINAYLGIVHFFIRKGIKGKVLVLLVFVAHVVLSFFLEAQ